jgi:hypothetical protein
LFPSILYDFHFLKFLLISYSNRDDKLEKGRGVTNISEIGYASPDMTVFILSNIFLLSPSDFFQNETFHGYVL